MKSAYATQSVESIGNGQPEAGPVMAEIAGQNRSLSVLYSAIDRLEKAISPILSPEGSDGCVGEPVPPPACELHDLLRNLTTQIDGIERRIATICRRVCI